MLDVCCYTGGFGISALVKGGAKEVTGVDLDEKAIALARITANSTRFAPPTSAPTPLATCGRCGSTTVGSASWSSTPREPHPGRLDIATGKQKYFDMNFLAMSIVEPGGFLVTCSCSGLLSPRNSSTSSVPRPARRDAQRKCWP